MQKIRTCTHAEHIVGGYVHTYVHMHMHIHATQTRGRLGAKKKSVMGHTCRQKGVQGHTMEQWQVHGPL